MYHLSYLTKKNCFYKNSFNMIKTLLQDVDVQILFYIKIFTKKYKNKIKKQMFLVQFIYVKPSCPSSSCRCQLKREKLEKQNKDLVCLYGALEKDKNDITEYLKHSVAAKEKEVDELVVQLEQQQRAAEQDREALKLQHSQQEQQLQKQIDKLNLGNVRQGETVTGKCLLRFHTLRINLFSFFVASWKAVAALWEMETTRAETNYYHFHY